MIIYQIQNLASGKSYIGQTINSLSRRWSSHVRGAEKGLIRCRALANAIRKYGEKSFDVKELACGFNIDDLNYLEQHFIENLNTLAPNGYNLHTGGLNHHPSPETLKKMAEATKGNAYHKGFKHSPEVRTKISLAIKGRVPSFTGRKHSEETKVKISAAKMGCLGPRKGAVLSEETRAKIAFAARNISEETRAKLSAAAIRRWQRSKSKSEIDISATRES